MSGAVPEGTALLLLICTEKQVGLSYVLFDDYKLAVVYRLILFSRTSDRVFLITSPSKQVRDATALMRHPCLMAGSPGPPVRTLLKDRRSNKKVYYPA